MNLYSYQKQQQEIERMTIEKALEPSRKKSEREIYDKCVKEANPC